MKKIGLLGGMSWESTASYYIEISQAVKAQLGGLHSAKLSLYSVDFSEIEALQHQGLWQDTATILSKAAQNVEAGGADFLLICTNTMHKVAHQIQSADVARISLSRLQGLFLPWLQRQRRRD